jgi:hypothetical protein
VASLPRVVAELLEWLLACEWSTPVVPTSVIVGGAVGVTATVVPPTFTRATFWFWVSSWLCRTCAAFAVLPRVGTNDVGTVTGTGFSDPNAPFGTGFGVSTFVRVIEGSRSPVSTVAVAGGCPGRVAVIDMVVGT